jgi:TonB family protein
LLRELLSLTSLALLLALLHAGPVLGDSAPPDASVGDAPPVESPLRQARARYLQLMEDERYPEAVAAAQEVLDGTPQDGANPGMVLVAPLNNLATAQTRAGLLPAAAKNYRAGIAIIERHEGIVSPRLMNGLLGLGEVHLRLEEFDAAAGAYERALKLGQLQGGLYDPGQIPVRDALSDVYAGMDDQEKADHQQESQVYAARRRLGATNPELAPALQKLGRWYDRTDRPLLARAAYQKAERVIADATDGASADLIPVLIAIARTWREQQFLPTDDEAKDESVAALSMAAIALRRALAVDARLPDADPLRRASIYAELGDLEITSRRSRAAAENYAEAWKLLSVDPALEARRSELLGEPVRLQGRPPPRIFPAGLFADKVPASQLSPGYVVVRYKLGTDGRPREVTVIEADPAGIADSAARLALERAYFRPRIEDGKPVAAEGLTRRHDFRYRRAKVKQPPTVPADAPLPVPPGDAQ